MNQQLKTKVKQAWNDREKFAHSRYFSRYVEVVEGMHPAKGTPGWADLNETLNVELFGLQAENQKTAAERVETMLLSGEIYQNDYGEWVVKPLESLSLFECQQLARLLAEKNFEHHRSIQEGIRNAE